MREIYLHNRLLYALMAVVFIFCLGFPYPIFLLVGQIMLGTILLLVIVEAAMLFSIRNPATASRIVEEKLSNGDDNPVILQLRSSFPFRTNLEIIDEFPKQLQLRDRSMLKNNLDPNFEEEVLYSIRPTDRGPYQFGAVHLFFSSLISFLKRRVTIDLSQTVKVYPSFIQARKFAFMAINNRIEEVGIKKIRKMGVNNEFEQIREYVQGDDFRVINWKASARNNSLMVNQYQEEQAQNIYCVVDKGRLMHMPFEGLSLMDYAINSTLVMSAIALGKSDKPGLVTFSDKIGAFMLAQGKRTQISLIADALYDQETRLRESDFARLYRNVKFRIKKRSLLIVFTNFDSMVTLRRQIKYLRALARDHLVVTVVFDNSEINQVADTKTFKLYGAYDQTMAEKHQHDKRLIVKELNRNGISTILTEPKNLTVDVINKYIELKARAAI